MIKTTETERAREACTPFLKQIDRALEEAHESVRILTTLRANIKRDMLGENPQGMQKVLDDVGPAIQKELDDEFNKSDPVDES